MTPIALVKLLEQTSDRLLDADVDAGLATVIAAVKHSAAPSEAIRAAQDLLPKRVSALEAASDELDALQSRVDYLANMIAFTTEGWPERKAELEAQLRDHPLVGLASWLGDWYAAAAYRRDAALSRLSATKALPEGAELLIERCRFAASGVETTNWHLSEQLLAAGAGGLSIGGQEVPASPDVREAIVLLSARLALASGLEDRAEQLLEQAVMEFSPAVLALRARVWRQRGDATEAQRSLERACAVAATDLYVISEAITQSRIDGRADDSLQAAQVAIDSLPVLTDVEAELGRLVDPPPELWIAAARRALLELDPDIAELAIERARAAVPWDDSTLLASVSDLAAQRADLAHEPAQTRSAAHLDAALQWLRAERLDEATAHFERVVELDPNNAEAKLRYADSLIALRQSLPLASARDDLQRALATIDEARQNGAVGPEYSWSHLSEAVAREALNGAVDARDNRQGWLALEAVCRGLVYERDNASRWCDLAAAANELSLFGVARAAAGRAAELEPYDDTVAAQELQALANSGNVEEALAHVGERDDAWNHAVRGWLLLHAGEPWQAAPALRTAELDRNWFWASEALITALLVTDRYEDAVTEAEATRARWEDRVGERDGVLAVAWTSAVLGDVERARELADLASDVAVEGQSHGIMAIVRTLDGDPEGALAELRAKISEMRSLTDLRGWPTTVVEMLHVLGAHKQLALPSMSDLDEDLASRRTVLEARRDPFVDLAHAPIYGIDRADLAVARAFTSALLHDARGERDAARAVTRTAALQSPSDIELQLLHKQLEGPAPVPESEPPQQEMPLLAAASSGSASSAGSGPPIESPLTALLPSSWFEGHADPVNDHAFFLRFIPEMRIRAGWLVPGVKVRAEQELEPDRFRILLDDELVDEGQVSPDYRYANRGALAFFGDDICAAASESGDLGLVSIPVESIAMGGPFADLLTMPAIEVVARRIGSVADEYAYRLGGPAGSRWDRVKRGFRRALASKPTASVKGK